MARNGTITGATYSTDVPAGKIGNYSLYFDGIDDVISIPSNPITDYNSPVTIAAWVKLNADAVDTAYSHYLCAAGGIYAQIRSSNNTFKIRWDNAAAQGPTGVNLGAGNRDWNFVCGTYNGNGVGATYLNGISTSNATLATLPTKLAPYGASPLTICQYPGSIYASMAIADLRIYNCVLSLAEIEKLSKGINIQRGLVARYNFEEGSGTTATDTAGNSNTGTAGVLKNNYSPIGSARMRSTDKYGIAI